MIPTRGSMNPETGKSYPRVESAARQQAPRDGQGLPAPPTTYIIDYGGVGKGLFVSREGEYPRAQPGTMPGFVATHPHPLRIVTESTYCSYQVAERREMLEFQEQRVIDLWLISPRRTARVRREMGLPKSDFNDVLAMVEIWRSTYHLRRATPPPTSEARVEQYELRLRQVEMRLSNYDNADARAIRGWLDPAPFAEELGGDRHGLNPWTYGVGLCAMVARSRQEFDRMVGMYGQGYPSKVRADAYRHRVRPLARRIEREQYQPSIFREPPVGDPVKLAMRRLRRASRYVWSRRSGT